MKFSDAGRLGRYEALGQEIGALVDQKNQAYGSSFSDSEVFLRLLYPDGIAPEAYPDVLLLVRIWDKVKRIATAAGRPDPMAESPYRDLAGYALLGAAK